ncbi:MAG: nanT 1 [Verrucomicrobiales bacterium]|nr:nanT 1 [Verrucomicrobiales bacterium]
MTSPAKATERLGKASALPEVEHFRDLSGQQWKSGIAAWLGWLFDGLDMHLYTLVATPFVATLLAVSNKNDPSVGLHASIIQGGFLLGWALGGGFFGRVGDRMGRSRALSLTVLTYALFTGLSFFAHTWWHLAIFRFLSALGIGGEWAVGASLLSETWPKKWRPWIAASLQTGVNLGVLLAVLANHLMAKQPPRYIFLVGVIPALLVFWIRKAVPEPEEWHAAKKNAGANEPAVSDLFRGDVKKITWLVILVCAVSLTAHWAFMFWHQVHLRKLPDVINLSPEQQNHLANRAMYIVMISSILGNFFAAFVAKRVGYRKSIAVMCVGYFVSMGLTYRTGRPYQELLWWLAAPGFFQGVFALFTMYLPPLFPTLLRTTGAGFCYNIGRVVAAAGTVFFGLFSYRAAIANASQPLDYRVTLFYAGMLFLPAAFFALFLPELRDRPQPVGQPVD